MWVCEGDSKDNKSLLNLIFNRLLGDDGGIKGG